VFNEYFIVWTTNIKAKASMFKNLLCLNVAISTYKESMRSVARRGFYRTRAVKTFVTSAKK
ncbi:MAG: hypothetical protein J6S23_07695, partial [Clostridia bacterium]|nr:hypothetical protein [Clostridia bacterium]